ncbi:hypothetical protein N5P32_03725 [Marinomonas pontica]|uniref:hypothetical protein n=1 Tax=Marinomonas pontica TaxID=264739 RepID=UPI0022440188|nr:hypothetical protein [Marinomonas pontica]MCW8355074.1 hypothetical protein [Marinomonas pontica]
MSMIQPITLSNSCRQATDMLYELDVYRGDLEHPNAPGNKWHKLQHHLNSAKQQNASVIATFGGPFSRSPSCFWDNPEKHAV